MPTRITCLSIMRDSGSYLDRYLLQLSPLIRELPDSRVVVVEGDSLDDTPAALLKAQADRPWLHVVTDNTGRPKWGSVNHPDRWAHLESVWNKAMGCIDDRAEVVVCLESDLVWSWAVLRACLAHVSLGVAPVVCPMLYGQDHFYDTNGFRLPNGKPFNQFEPVIPDWDGRRFIMLQTGGGMLVGQAGVMRQGVWKNQCRLFVPGGVMVDTELRIYHP